MKIKNIPLPSAVGVLLPKGDLSCTRKWCF